MKTILLSVLSALCYLAGYAGNPAVIFQTSRATGMPATLKMRLAEPGKINVDWGDGFMREYAVGAESTAVEGLSQARLSKYTAMECSSSTVPTTTSWTSM